MLHLFGQEQEDLRQGASGIRVGQGEGGGSDGDWGGSSRNEVPVTGGGGRAVDVGWYTDMVRHCVATGDVLHLCACTHDAYTHACTHTNSHTHPHTHTISHTHTSGTPGTGPAVVHSAQQGTRRLATGAEWPTGR